MDQLKTPQQVGETIVTVSKYLGKEPHRALAMLEPFCSITEFAGATPEQNLKLRSMIYGTAGDCYRALGDMATAADWYRRASEQWKEGGYPSLYAEMVIANRLVDHYQNALDCLKHDRARWKARPLSTRVYYNVVSKWWLHWAGWKWRMRQRGLVPKLEALLRERGGAV
jgi:hypothetical protein